MTERIWLPVIKSLCLRSYADEAKYVLIGIDKVTFWGEHNTTLGWYRNEEDILNEIKEINNAISHGDLTYELKYKADVEIKFAGVKIKSS